MNIELYNGEAVKTIVELVSKGVKVDSIITDIPYGTTRCKFDVVIPFDDMWNCIKNIRKDKCPVVLFGTEPFSSYLRVSNIKEFKYDWIWNKILKTGHLNSKIMPMSQHEKIHVFGKGKLNYYPIMTEGSPQHSHGNGDRQHSANYNSQTKIDDSRAGNTLKYPSSILTIQKKHASTCIHPQEKPVELMEYLVNTYSKDGDTVLDFTMGSGTTGVACKNLNRNFIGIEKDVDIFETAKKRIENT